MLKGVSSHEKYAKTREIFEFIRDIRAGGVRFEFREASFPSFLKKRTRFRFLTERGYKNSVFNPKAKRRLSPFSQPFFNAKNERFGDFARNISKKNILKVQSKYRVGNFVFLECVFSLFLSLTERKKYRIFEVSCSVAQR